MNTILILNERSSSCRGLLCSRKTLSSSTSVSHGNKDFSALNKRTCESFFKITPENDKINFAFSYQDSFAISLLLKYTLIHYLLFRNLKNLFSLANTSASKKHLAIIRHSIESLRARVNFKH